MPSKILALDISADAISAVQIKSGLKGSEITACVHIKLQGEDGLDNALKSLSEQIELKNDIYQASIASSFISLRNITMPFNDLKKIRQALPFDIEPLVPISVDEFLTDFYVIERSNETKLIAGAVKKEYIAKYLQQLQENSINPEGLNIRCVPTVMNLLKQQEKPDNGLFLDIGFKHITLILFIKRRITLIRTIPVNGGIQLTSSYPGHSDDRDRIKTIEKIQSRFKSFCRTIRNTIHSHSYNLNQDLAPEKIFYTGTGAIYSKTKELLEEYLGISAEKIDLSKHNSLFINSAIAQDWNPLFMDNALALALGTNKKGEGFNFRRDDFELKKVSQWNKQIIRKASIAFTFIIVLLAVDISIDYYYLKKRYKALNQEIREVFKETLPQISKIVDPLQQMQVALNEIKKSTSPLPGSASNTKTIELLSDISKRIPASVNIQLTRLIIDSDVMRIGGITDTFNQVDTIKSKLEGSKYFNSATISSANLDQAGEKIKFEIKLQRQ